MVWGFKGLVDLHSHCVLYARERGRVKNACENDVSSTFILTCFIIREWSLITGRGGYKTGGGGGGT